MAIFWMSGSPGLMNLGVWKVGAAAHCYVGRFIPRTLWEQAS
jgi:hypothetical protein